MNKLVFVQAPIYDANDEVEKTPSSLGARLMSWIIS
jgi:hypothetical protein